VEPYCNLALPRQVLQLDPHFIAHMPCRAAVYMTDGKDIRAADLLPTNHTDPRVSDFARRVNKLQREITEHAAH